MLGGLPSRIMVMWVKCQKLYPPHFNFFKIKYIFEKIKFFYLLLFIQIKKTFVGCTYTFLVKYYSLFQLLTINQLSLSLTLPAALRLLESSIAA